MSELPEVNEYYKRHARDLTDMLFDKGFLDDSLARRAIDWLEDYLGYILQSQCEMAVRGDRLSKSIRHLEIRQVKAETETEDND